MFKNMKIGVKLGAGFAIVLMILSIISVVSLQAMQSMDVEVDSMINDKYPKTVWSNNVIDSINAIARSMRNTLLFKDEKQIKVEIDRIQESRKAILDNIDKLEKEAMAATRTKLVQDKLSQDTALAVGNTGAEFEAFIKQEQARWKPVIARAQIKPDGL